MSDNTEKLAPSFAIFHARDAVFDEEGTSLRQEPPSPTVIEGSARLREAGALEGSRVCRLFSRPGMSLTYVWFKSGYPLPRHSHDSDCLYFIVGGSLRMGDEELGPGDGFFVGADVPYTYIPGENGVEVLEFRDADIIDIKLRADNPAFWRNAMEAVLRERDAWKSQTSPSGLEI